jgi:hypothetical protein
MSDERPAGRDPQREAFGSDRIEIRPPRPDEALSGIAARDRIDIAAAPLALALVAALGFAWIGGSHLLRLAGLAGAPAGPAAVQAVVERIIFVESSGDANLKNKRSSATGAAQFLDQTWLEMIRSHRPDLANRGEKEVLELRRDPELAREIVTRWVERNAAMLTKRGLPVTPGTLYLTYFAGPAGAVAVLTVAEDADAASLMASADASGRTTREKLVASNPFLGALTVGDLKSWADRRMRGY